MINYVIKRGEISDIEIFKELLYNHSGEVRKSIMTIFEQHQKEKQEQFKIGVQQGMQQGKRESLYDIAKKMLLRGGYHAEIIANITGLTMDEINSIKTKLGH